MTTPRMPGTSGKGFSVVAAWQITPHYKAALVEHGFTAAMGGDASVQPGKLQQMMLHETAVSWLRTRLAETVPREAWLETRAEYTKACCDDINRNLDVDELCRAFRSRVDKFRQREGGHLKE